MSKKRALSVTSSYCDTDAWEQNTNEENWSRQRKCGQISVKRRNKQDNMEAIMKRRLMCPRQNEDSSSSGWESTIPRNKRFVNNFRNMSRNLGDRAGSNTQQSNSNIRHRERAVKREGDGDTENPTPPPRMTDCVEPYDTTKLEKNHASVVEVTNTSVQTANHVTETKSDELVPQNFNMFKGSPRNPTYFQRDKQDDDDNSIEVYDDTTREKTEGKVVNNKMAVFNYSNYTDKETSVVYSSLSETDEEPSEDSYQSATIPLRKVEEEINIAEALQQQYQPDKNSLSPNREEGSHQNPTRRPSRCALRTPRSNILRHSNNNCKRTSRRF